VSRLVRVVARRNRVQRLAAIAIDGSTSLLDRRVLCSYIRMDWVYFVEGLLEF
jgi:hypothetical protein